MKAHSRTGCSLMAIQLEVSRLSMRLHFNKHKVEVKEAEGLGVEWMLASLKQL